MTDDEKREHAEMVHELAEAIKYSLGMGEYGPPMEGEEGWVPPADIGWQSDPVAVARALFGWPADPSDLRFLMTVEDADDEDFDTTAQAIMDELREKKERRMAEERAKAAEPKPQPSSDDPWSVIGKAEDDGEWLMKKIRDFG